MSKPIEKPQNIDDKSLFGFWVYLMTDCVLFASLFATFAVLRGSTFGGPSGEDIFHLPFALAETLILLTSSFTCGLGLVAARSRRKNLTLLFFAITFVLGAAFLTLELHEFNHLYNQGFSWRRSAFLTSFFTLVGTHGAHITIGLLWMAIMMIKLYASELNTSMVRKITMLGLFWHFLDLIWIFIFTIVYMFGAVL